MADYKKIDIGVSLRHYKRSEVQNAIVNEAGSKEIAVSYGGTGYGKRPDVLLYPLDVLESVKKRATSFHCSEELWSNPLQISTSMKPKEMDDLRIGWDLILDIDCPELEFSKLAAHYIIEALKYYGVRSYGVKFSGNHGFHIGVPFEAFPSPVAGKQTKNLFPEAPRKIAILLQEKIRKVLAEHLLKVSSLEEIAEKIGKPVQKIVKSSRLDPFEVLDIDTILITTRHLYRMPYSINEKSGLVSVVIIPDEVLPFNKASAAPEKVDRFLPFLQRDNVVHGEARKLLIEALDFNPVVNVEIKERMNKEKKNFEPLADAIPEQYFPPCVQKIKKGLSDGRKRGLFILLNFLSSVGWSYDQTEQFVREWNKKNTEPLREVYLLGQLKQLKKKSILPPNCDNEAYMKDLLVCEPDGFCKWVKNPAQYASKRQRAAAREAEKGSKRRKSRAETKPSKEGAPTRCSQLK